MKFITRVRYLVKIFDGSVRYLMNTFSLVYTEPSWKFVKSVLYRLEL